MTNSININTLNNINNSTINASTDISKNKFLNITGTINNSNIKDSFGHASNNEEVEKLRLELDTIQKQQGLIGKAWNRIKKIFGGGSKKVEKAISRYEKGEISLEQAKKALDKYQKGQKISVDVAAEMISAITSVIAYNTTIPKDKISVGAGLLISTSTGAGVKAGIKYADAKVGGREYTKKDLTFDLATGAINGFMGPVSNALGAKATEKIGKKLGLDVISDGVKTVVNEAGKSGIKNTIKNIMTTQFVDVKGGTILKRALALGTGMAIDGALSGASSNMVRAGFNGENVLRAGAEGAIGGAITAPIIGGGFRMATKAGKALNNKIVTKRVLKDGMQTTFKQGEKGDCSLLTIIDGLMNNKNAQNKIKESITKSVGGDYFVKIGDRTVKVAKDAITDEMLSDVTGIRIFEQAYKQIAGDLDGGFADVVAKQFGLHPVHIDSESITDELLSTLSKQKDNTVLSLGLNVDDIGNIAENGTNRHYFTIRDIDTTGKKVSLTNPYDTSKVIEMTFEDVKKMGISIDGGTVTKTNIHNSVREAGESVFKGIDVTETQKSLIKLLQDQEVDIDKFRKLLAAINPDGAEKTGIADLSAMMELYGIKAKDLGEYMETRFGDKLGKWLECCDEGEALDSITNILKDMSKYRLYRNSDFFESFHISFADMPEIIDELQKTDITRINIQKISEILKKNNEELFNAVGAENFIYKNLNKMRASVSNSAIPYGVYTTPDDLIEMPVRINGERKTFIFKDATSIPSTQHANIDYDLLIESNMITTDLLDEASKYIGKGEITCKTNGIPGVSNEKFGVDFAKILGKIDPENPSLSQLSTREVHGLTDTLRTLLDPKKGNPKFIKAVTNNDILKQKCNRIYDVIDYLRREATNSLVGTNVEISDHAFLRMIDRNLTSVVDNSTGDVLDFSSLISLLAKNAQKNIDTIPLYEGSAGIKMILKRNGNKIVIDSVM